MTQLKILNKNEKKEIEAQLQEQFGIESVEGTILMAGHERLFLFQGSLSEKNLFSLERKANIERVGIYFAKIMPGEDSIKLSIEGTQALSSQIKKNIFEINEEQMDSWMKGEDLQINTGRRGFLVIKYKEDFLGCGKASEHKIGNFIPKSRRLKERTIRVDSPRDAVLEE